MKTVILLFAATIGLVTMANANTLPTSFKEEITKNIDYPSFAQENMVEGEVWMKVTLNENSKVEIVDISSTNPELKEFVLAELNDVTIENTSIKAEDIYFMKVKFELIK